MPADNNAKLKEIFAEVFEFDPARVDDTLHQRDIEKWDSLGMVNLVAEIESAFGIEFELLDFERLVSVGAIKEVLQMRGVSFG